MVEKLSTLVRRFFVMQNALREVILCLGLIRSFARWFTRVPRLPDAGLGSRHPVISLFYVACLSCSRAISATDSPENLT